MPWNPQDAYNNGLRGTYSDPDAHERLTKLITSQGQSPDGGDTIRNYGLFGSGEGKLSPLFSVIEKVFPGSLPATAQGVGSCVAHGTRNAALGSLAAEIAAGTPDEVTGKIEGKPEVSDVAQRDGVLSTEAIYWWRGHSGKDGWNCDHAAEVICGKSGLWLRKNYPDIGIDLTKYSARTEVKWGRPLPPESVGKIGREHLMRTATRVKSFDELRDLIHNGYAISSCGGESFSSKRDENGVSSRTRGGWAHAMAYLGVDDREEVRRKYGGEPLVLVQNSWGRWGSGPRKVYGTDLEIPVGSFWARWKDIRSRYAVAFSGVNGWPPQRFDSWLGGIL
jgi:hypothetical protein